MSQVKDWQQEDFKIYVEQHGVTPDVREMIDTATSIDWDTGFAGGSYGQFILIRPDGRELTMRAHYRGPVHAAIYDRMKAMNGE